MKDPFYRQILEALESRLDGDLFEACAVDLLRERFPTLVPITGGDDGGMDGAIADGECEPFPLACTTEDDVIGNLTGSLERCHETGGRRRKVVVATSRKLSPPRRRNLRDRARELGFTLVQVYEQRAMAAMLYRNSRWCQDLFELPGKPAALFAVPPSSKRPLVELQILGRDKDAEWLRSTSGDRVLVGAPGVGKTYLLYRLALEGWGLFLASEDEAEIGNAIRDQKPGVIVVDDAHADPGRLARLVGLRREIGATFDIVATTWRGRRDDVAEALNVPEGRIRTLEPLPRRLIQQILEELGVEASDEDLRELVDQAANKPGLATTLAAMWLEGDWLSVLRGEALARNTLHCVRRLVGRKEEALLAVFGLGGRCGMPVKRVAEKLGLGALEIRERVTSLTAAGVLSDEVGGDRLAVQPRALRPVLLSSVFFPREGPALGDYRDFLDLAPGYDCAVREVVAAAARGARISADELRRLLGGLDPAAYPLRQEARAAWATYAGLGQEEAFWAFEHYPGDLVDVARPGLVSAPEATIGRLLEQAEAPESPVSSQALPQLEVLRIWLHELVFPEEETIERRRLAIRVARDKAEATDSADAHAAAFRLACLALRPAVEKKTIDPTRTGLITRRGPLSQAQAEQMQRVWKDALDLFEVTGVVSFPELFDELTEWRRLADFRGRTSEDEERSLQQFVIRMVRDLTPLAEGRAGLTVALARLADELAIELPLEPDPRFEILFPGLEEALSENLMSEPAPLRALVDEWADASPAEVVETLLHLTREARCITLGHYDRVWDVCRRLAAETRRPEPWFDALLEKEAPSSWLAPFLDRLATLSGFGERARACLKEEGYAEVTIRTVLRLPQPPADLLEAALERAVADPSVVRGMALRGELSTPVASSLLAHPDPALALATAFGEWQADPQGEVRPELREPWRQAVLRSTELASRRRIETYELTELLAADPELAYEWLLRLDASAARPESAIRSAARSALGFLAPERKGDLLDRLSADSVLVDDLLEF